jgi:hypothetical protein
MISSILHCHLSCGYCRLWILALWEDEVNYEYCLSLNISALHKEYIDIICTFGGIVLSIPTINCYLRHFVCIFWSVFRLIVCYFV